MCKRHGDFPVFRLIELAWEGALPDRRSLETPKLRWRGNLRALNIEHADEVMMGIFTYFLITL